MTRVRTSWQQSRRRPAWGSLCVAVLVLLAPTGASAATPVSFQPAETYPVHSSPYAVAVGELTGDGRSDVVSANSQTGDVSVLLSEPDGKLAPAINYSVGNSVPIAVTIGDVTGDGHNDIVVATTDPNEIVVLPGDGNGKLGAPISSPTPTGGPVSFLALGDFNKDGTLDLVTANGFAGTISIDPGVGDGTFDAAAAKTYSAAAEPNSNLATVRVADFNHDGKLDVASATSGCGYLNSGRGEVEIHLGNGHGELETEPVADVRDSCVASMNVADLNKDGIPDIVTANEEPQSGGGYLSTILSKGNGSVGSLILSPPIAFPASPAALTLPDLNGDGTPDAAVATTGGQIAVLTGNGDGTFGSPQTFSANATYVDGITYGDFNGDGKPDIVTADQAGGVSSGGSVSVFLNSTGVTPQQPSSPQPPAQQPSTPPITNPSPMAQLCSLVDWSGQSPTGKLLGKLKGKTLQVAHDTIAKYPITFEMYLTAGFEDVQVCEANLSLLNVLPFTIHDPAATVETSPTGSAGQRSFSYEPASGWVGTAPGTPWAIQWSDARVEVPNKSVNLTSDEGKLSFEQSPLVVFHGPLLTTELVREGTSLQPITLEALLKPEIFAGMDTSVTLPLIYCFSQTSLLSQLFGFLSRFSNTLAEQLEGEAKQEFEGSLRAVMKKIGGLTAFPQQVTEAVSQLSSAYGAACEEGEAAGITGQLVGALAGLQADATPAEVIQLAPGATPAVEDGAGEIVVELVPALAADTAHAGPGASENEVMPSPGTPPAGTIELLRSRRATLTAKGLRIAKLPHGLRSVVGHVAPWRLNTLVGRLLIGGKLGPGQWIDVAGGRFSSHARHDDEIILSGPGYLGQRLVRASHGIAAANIKLPNHMASGTWTLAIVDESGVGISHHRLRGRTQVRLTSFVVSTAGKHRHPKRHAH